jgi:hypothetical protein
MKVPSLRAGSRASLLLISLYNTYCYECQVPAPAPGYLLRCQHFAVVCQYRAITNRKVPSSGALSCHLKAPFFRT